MKLLLTLMVSITSLLAEVEYNQAFAKIAIPFKTSTNNVKVTYMMPPAFTQLFTQYFEDGLKNKNIEIGSGDEVVILPVKLYNIEKLNRFLYKSKSIPSAKLEDIKARAQKANTAITSPAMLAAFTSGFTAHGVGMGASSVGAGLSDAATAGLFSLGVGFAVTGIESVTNNHDRYGMVTDVYVNGKRMRIVAMVNSDDAEPEEALIKLCQVTIERLLKEFNSAKGAKQDAA